MDLQLKEMICISYAEFIGNPQTYLNTKSLRASNSLETHDHT